MINLPQKKPKRTFWVNIKLERAQKCFCLSVKLGTDARKQETTSVGVLIKVFRNTVFFFNKKKNSHLFNTKDEQSYQLSVKKKAFKMQHS